MEEPACFLSELLPLKTDTVLSETQAAGNALGMHTRSRRAEEEEMKSRPERCVSVL